jgi:hypothetical protein
MYTFERWEGGVNTMKFIASETPVLDQEALQICIDKVEKIIKSIKTCHTNLETHIELIKTQANPPLSTRTQYPQLEYDLLIGVGPCVGNYDDLKPFLEYAMPLADGLEFIQKMDIIKEKINMAKLEASRFFHGKKNDLKTAYTTDLNTAILNAGEQIHGTLKTQMLYYLQKTK